MHCVKRNKQFECHPMKIPCNKSQYRLSGTNDRHFISGKMSSRGILLILMMENGIHGMNE